MNTLHLLTVMMIAPSCLSQKLESTPLVTAENSVETIAIETQTHDGFPLRGHLKKKSSLEKAPLVMLMAGSGPLNRYEMIGGSSTTTGEPTLLFKEIEDKLVAKGFAVLIYDKRGVIPEDDSFLKDQYDWDIYATATVRNLEKDAETMLHHTWQVLGHKIDLNIPTQLMGHSEGTYLALYLKDQFPQRIGQLHLLGIYTRSMREVLKYQFVTRNIDAFHLIDENSDEKITPAEAEPFLQDTPPPGISMQLDLDQSGAIDLSEMKTVLDQQYSTFMSNIEDVSTEWKGKTPREWFLQHLTLGSLLERHAEHCTSIDIYQGEIDAQTPLADANALKKLCSRRQTPLNSLTVYEGLGHGFSPNLGHKKWRPTLGPMSSEVAKDIAHGVELALSNTITKKKSLFK